MTSESGTAPEAKRIFEAVGVTKEFDEGRVKALRGVDFTIDEGDFVSIIGTSGSGKTTLLHMLGSLDFPTSGTLSFQGTPISRLPDPAGFRAHEVGYIFQSFHLLPTFSIEENVQIPMFGVPGYSKKQRRDRSLELIDAVGLSHRLGHLPSKLSGGERQRAAIARSLANRPSVLLADEPTGNLDSKNATQVMELLARIQQEHGTTTILVTHDLQVANYGSRLIRMSDGQIVPEEDSTERSPSPIG